MRRDKHLEELPCQEIGDITGLTENHIAVILITDEKRKDLGARLHLVPANAHALAAHFSCVKNASAYLDTRYNLASRTACQCYNILYKRFLN